MSFFFLFLRRRFHLYALIPKSFPSVSNPTKSFPSTFLRLHSISEIVPCLILVWFKFDDNSLASSATSIQSLWQQINLEPSRDPLPTNLNNSSTSSFNAWTQTLISALLRHQWSSLIGAKGCTQVSFLQTSLSFRNSPRSFVFCSICRFAVTLAIPCWLLT